MKRTLPLSLLSIGVTMFFAGCAPQSGQTGAQQKQRYTFTSAPTGSNIPQRVATTSSSRTNRTSSAEQVSPDAFRDIQHRGSVNRGTGN
jgi:hypothetical protein